MDESLEIRFACPACGVWGDSGLASCAVCGHRFEPEEIVTTPRSRPALRRLPVPPDRSWPVVPPSSSRGWTFRIGPGLALIALISVCLAAFREDVVLGVLVTLGLMPATLRTLYYANQSRSDGWPMSTGEQVNFFMVSLAAFSFVIASTIIVGLMTAGLGACAGGNVYVGVLLGLTGGTFYAVKIWPVLMRHHRPKSEGIRFEEGARPGSWASPFDEP